MYKEWRGHSYALTKGASLGKRNPSQHPKNAPRQCVCIANAC